MESRLVRQNHDNGKYYHRRSNQKDRRKEFTAGRRFVANVVKDASFDAVSELIAGLGYNSISAAYFISLGINKDRALASTSRIISAVSQKFTIKALPPLRDNGQVLEHARTKPRKVALAVELEIESPGWYTITPTTVVNVWRIMDKRKLLSMRSHISSIPPSKMRTFFFTDIGRNLLLGALGDLALYFFDDAGTWRANIGPIELSVHTLLWFCSALAGTSNVSRFSLDAIARRVCVLNFILTSKGSTLTPVENFLPGNLRQMYSSLISQKDASTTEGILGQCPGFDQMVDPAGRVYYEKVIDYAGTHIKYVITSNAHGAQLRHAKYYSLNGIQYTLGVSAVTGEPLEGAASQVCNACFYVLKSLAMKMDEETDGKLYNYDIDMFEGRGSVLDDLYLSQDADLKDIYSRYCFIISGCVTRLQIARVRDSLLSQRPLNVEEMYEVIINATRRTFRN